MPYQDTLRFLFLNKPTSRRYIALEPETTRIPRIIHQTYRNWKALAPEIRDSIIALQARNPGWEYRFYDDEAMEKFVRDGFDDVVVSRYKRIDPSYGAARADLFRYLLAYRVGGVYLDIKSTVNKPLNEVLQSDDRLLLAQWSQGGRFEGAGRHEWDFAGRIQGGEFQQWHVIAAPGHPYLYAVVQAVLRNIDCYIPSMHGTGRNAVLRLTGPIAYTLAILPHLSLGLHRVVAGHEELSLDYSMFPKNDGHKLLFATHYSDLTVPVIHASCFRRMLSGLYRLLNTLRNR